MLYFNLFYAPFPLQLPTPVGFWSRIAANLRLRVFFSIAFVPSTLCGGEDICGATGFSHLSYVEPIDAVVCWVFRQEE